MKKIQNLVKSASKLVGDQVGRIFSTTNYAKFKYYKGNRNVAKHRVKAMVNLLKGGRYNIPILVKEDKRDGMLVIMDGQTRYEACMELGIPILFVLDKIDDPKTASVVEMPYNSIPVINKVYGWTAQDYVDTQANVGIQEALDLKDIQKDYTLKLGQAISFLFGEVVNKKRVSDQNFPDYDISEGISAAEIINPFQKGNNHKLFKNVYFLAELRWYVLDKSFDFKYLIKTLNKNPELFTQVTSIGDADSIINRVFGNKRGKYHKILPQWKLNVEVLKSQY